MIKKIIMKKRKLWEILVPTHFNNHIKIGVEHHKQWDLFVESITKGLTIENPTRGIWINHEGMKYEERMIPVKISCTREQIEVIIDFTAKHYEQEAISFYKISDEMHIVNYDSSFKRIV